MGSRRGQAPEQLTYELHLSAGLETLSHLSLRKKYELQVDMEDFEGVKVFARYSSFSVDPEASGFTLHVSGFTDGGAGEEQQEVLDVFLMFRRRSHT